eukprot:16570_1
MGNRASKDNDNLVDVRELSDNEKALVLSKFIRDISVDIPIEIQQLIYHYLQTIINIEYIKLSTEERKKIHKWNGMKIVLVDGLPPFSSQVGKSCLLLRYLENTFTNGWVSNSGLDFRMKTMIINDEYFRLLIFDTSQTQGKFRTPITKYIRGNIGIFILFDVSDKISFNYIDEVVETIDNYNYTMENNNKMLIGNKIDLKEKRVISYDTALQLANQKEMKYFEVSAKTGENVNEAFEAMISDLYKKKMYSRYKANIPKDVSKKHNCILM